MSNTPTFVIVEDNPITVICLTEGLKLLAEMKTAPTPIIHSASTHSDAMNLMELLPETVCWILDGNYPESPGKLAVCMGPTTAKYIQQKRKDTGDIIIGFTSDPSVYTGSGIRVFDKADSDLFLDSLSTIIDNTPNIQL